MQRFVYNQLVNGAPRWKFNESMDGIGLWTVMAPPGATT